MRIFQQDNGASRVITLEWVNLLESELLEGTVCELCGCVPSVLGIRFRVLPQLQDAHGPLVLSLYTPNVWRRTLMVGLYDHYLRETVGNGMTAMSHASKINLLTDELVQLITGFSPTVRQHVSIATATA